MPTALRDIRFGRLGVALEARADGSLRVRSTEALATPRARLTDYLAEWTATAPERTFLAERGPGGAWRHVSYAESRAAVDRIAAALLARRLSADRPLAILSGNGIEHALLTLAAMHVGIPAAPVSPSYALLSADFGKLRAILAQLTPGLVFAADAGPFARAIAACCEPRLEVVTCSGALADRSPTPLAALLECEDAASVAAASAKVGPDTVAKVLFTSGSTGAPKGVITTQRMLCANQAMLRHWLPFLEHEPPVLVDWLPWHHTFGGSHNLGLVLANGGTLYIDGGKPTPAGMGETLRNLAEVAPTIYFNVPKGWDDLVQALARGRRLRETFFSRLRLTFYSGASLAPHIAEALSRLAEETVGERILLVTGFGSTETAPAALVNTLATARLGNIGVPLPGIEVKLVPAGGKLEARIKGPTITPGYWREAVATRAAFDEEGFYRLGDAFRFAAGQDPKQGFIFDGRVSEDFKLATGTWVSVGPLRAGLVAALAPLAKEAVIAGHDRDEVAALVIPDPEACRALLGTGGVGADDAVVLAAAPVRAAFAARLAALALSSTGSSTRVARLMLLAEPPSIDAGEITDKGSINQRAVLARRAALVEELYALPPSPRVIEAG